MELCNSILEYFQLRRHDMSGMVFLMVAYYFPDNSIAPFSFVGNDYSGSNKAFGLEAFKKKLAVVTRKSKLSKLC